HLITALFARPDHKILGVALDRSGPAGGRGAGFLSYGQRHQHRRGVRFVQKQQRLFHRHLMPGLIVRVDTSPMATRAWSIGPSKVALVDTEFLARSVAGFVT